MLLAFLLRILICQFPISPFMGRLSPTKSDRSFSHILSAIATKDSSICLENKHFFFQIYFSIFTRSFVDLPLCSHILATIYFAESINSQLGFWGIPCNSYFQFLFGFCNSQSIYPIYDRVLMGEYSTLNNM